MEYNKVFNEEEQDYLEIKVIKVPESIKKLENRLRSKVELTPIQ